MCLQITDAVNNEKLYFQLYYVHILWPTYFLTNLNPMHYASNNENGTVYIKKGIVKGKNYSKGIVSEYALNNQKVLCKTRKDGFQESSRNTKIENGNWLGPHLEKTSY